MSRPFRRALPLPPMALFALAALTPFAALGFGIWAGGLWVLPGLLYMAGLTACLDHLIRRTAPDAPEGAEFPAADGLLLAVGLAHLVLFPLSVWAIAGDSGLSAAARVILFLAAGQMFGQISNPAAHELIHRGQRGLYRLGVLVYATMLNAHHASAHRLVHHRHVATPLDPNSARAGESFYRFLPRAYFGSFRAGLAAESEMLARKGRGLHPYALYLPAQAAALALGYALAGWAGLAIWTSLGLYATAQLMLSDYVQHYGLERAPRAPGRYEPVGPRHSWDAPHFLSSLMMVNAPRHSDHHSHPARAYPGLRLERAEKPRPLLPYSLPVMAAIATMPHLWRRVMDRRVARMREY